MTRKKSYTTVTLRDFHGGSIPSDLPLPSAPGMTVDRGLYERQSWMSPTLGRGYGGDRSGYHRQGSSNNAARTFEDKASYFPNPANIGRNYDEDERKPVESRPRSSHSPDRYDDHGFEERRGGSFSLDRYTLDDQGTFGTGPPNFSESRTSVDRFSSSGGGNAFEVDNYVHDEFGLIPVGPLPPRVPPRELPRDSGVRQQLSSYHQELAQSPPQYTQAQQMPAAPQAVQQQKFSSSPPRPWRHSSQGGTGGRGAGESATNVWTARRDGDYNRASASEPFVGDSVPWQPQSSAVRIVEASAVDKSSSGRWQCDATKVSGPSEIRPEPFSVPEQILEPALRQSSYGCGYATDGGRLAHPPEAVHYSPEISRVSTNPDSGRNVYSNDGAQISFDDGGRGVHNNPRRVGFSQSGKAGYSDSLHVDYLERRGFSEGGRVGFLEPTQEQLSSRGSFPDGANRAGYVGEAGCSSFVDDRWGNTVGFPESERMSTADIGRIVSSDGGRDLDQGRGFVGEVERMDYRDTSRSGPIDVRAGLGYSGRGFSVQGQFENARNRSSDPRRYPESGQQYSENGSHVQTSFVLESGVDLCGRSQYSVEGARTPFPSEASIPYPVEAPWGLYAANGVLGSTALERELVVGPGAVSPDHLLPVAESGRTMFPSSTTAVLDSLALDSPRPGPPAGRSEAAERPKLILLPRSKPLGKQVGTNATGEDAFEESVRDVCHHSDEKRQADILSLEPASLDGTTVHYLSNTAPLGSSDIDDEINRPSERPKLHLKPRSQCVSTAPEEVSEKVRQSVFGGARPRELVLKERGGDDPINGLLDVGSNSSLTTVKIGKSERLENARVEKQESWVDETHGSRRHDRQDKSLERQGSSRLLESNRVDRNFENPREFERKDSRKDLERQESWRNVERFENRQYERQDSRRDYNRQDSRREDSRRDIDKQDSWRRPAESPVVTTLGPRNPSSTVSSLVDLSPVSSGKYSYGPTASAVELAQAFSRSSSIGSTVTGASRGANSQRSPLSPVPKSSAPGFGPGYGNGVRDAPFSRLAEGPPNAPIASNRDLHLPGLASEGQANGYGNSGSYVIGDLSRAQSFGRSEANTGRDRFEDNDDLPGKRGLPLRQKEGYYE